MNSSQNASSLATDVKDAIIDAIENDDIVLPTLPEVALQVREAAEDPDACANSLSDVLGSDAGLSARVVKVANSPLFRASKEIDDLKAAVGRLGIDYTCNLATGLAMQQMFQATSDHIDKILRDVWTHSTQVASISHVLAKHYTRLRPDRATLSGLVHLIGVLPILTYAEEHSAVSDSFTLNQIIENTHAEIGIKILETWDFPEEIACIPSEHTNFQRKVDKVDYADLVMIANLQSYAGTGHPLTEMDFSNVSAFERIGLNPDEYMEAEDISEDMEAAMAMLQ